MTDHHALIITDNVPEDISAEQRIIYDMIAARMLEAFYGKCAKKTQQLIRSIKCCIHCKKQ